MSKKTDDTESVGKGLVTSDAPKEARKRHRDLAMVEATMQESRVTLSDLPFANIRELVKGLLVLAQPLKETEFQQLDSALRNRSRVPHDMGSRRTVSVRNSEDILNNAFRWSPGLPDLEGSRSVLKQLLDRFRDNAQFSAVLSIIVTSEFQDLYFDAADNYLKDGLFEAAGDAIVLSAATFFAVPEPYVSLRLCSHLESMPSIDFNIRQFKHKIQSFIEKREARNREVPIILPHEILVTLRQRADTEASSESRQGPMGMSMDAERVHAIRRLGQYYGQENNFDLADRYYRKLDSMTSIYNGHEMRRLHLDAIESRGILALSRTSIQAAAGFLTRLSEELARLDKPLESPPLKLADAILAAGSNSAVLPYMRTLVSATKTRNRQYEYWERVISLGFRPLLLNRVIY